MHIAPGKRSEVKRREEYIFSHLDVFPFTILSHYLTHSAALLYLNSGQRQGPLFKENRKRRSGSTLSKPKAPGLAVEGLTRVRLYYNFRKQRF